MPRSKEEIIKKIEDLIQDNVYSIKTADSILKYLQILYMIDDKALIIYIEMLFDSDFEKSPYAKHFIEFLGTLNSDDFIILIENIFSKINKYELKKLIIEKCSNISNYKIKFFLNKQVEDPLYSLEAKLTLVKLGESQYINELINEYESKLNIGVFLSKYLDSLSEAGSRKVWKITSEYIVNDNLDERNRYRILNHILKISNKNSTQSLINLYQYYLKHPDISSKEVRDISFKLSLKKENKSSNEFTQKLLLLILDKLKEYSYKDDVKEFLEKNNNYK